MTIVSLPGVEPAGHPRVRPDTVRQLKVRVAALEAENARLRAYLDDPDRLISRVMRLTGGLPVEAP